MPNIANSQQWYNEDGTRRDDGSAVVSDSGSRFERLVAYTRYPETNSEFGRKTAKFTLCGITVKNDFEVFFLASGVNHPKCKVSDEVGCETCPNWFYYWKEGNVCSIPRNAQFKNVAVNDEEALLGQMNNLSSIITLTSFTPIERGREHAYYYSNKVVVVTNKFEVVDGEEIEMHFVITNRVKHSFEVGAAGIGIRAVAATIKHEQCHFDISQTIVGEDNDIPVYVVFEGEEGEGFSLRDRDGDFVLDADEEGCKWGVASDPADPDTYQMALISAVYARYGDNEVRARLAETNDLENSYFPQKDWSVPGSQYQRKKQ